MSNECVICNFARKMIELCDCAAHPLPPQRAGAGEPATAMGTVHKIEHDGFEGTVQGYYVTREGKRGVVLQQVGTRVVHVYGEKWIAAPAQS